MTFSTFEAYEQLLYTLSQAYPSIQESTLVLIRHGQSVAVVRGTLRFSADTRLVVREHLLTLPVVQIDDYGYEVWKGNRSSIGMMPNLTPTSPHYKALIPTTSSPKSSDGCRSSRNSKRPSRPT